MNVQNVRNVHLDRRLKTVAELVRLDKRIADIGTDHALVPCWLFRQGAKEIYASDIAEGPLSRAKVTAEQFGITEIRLLLSDGLNNIPPVDDVIVAGMGGEMIADIVSRCSFLNEDMHFILQPMTKDNVLRRELYKNGFEIAEEKTASVSKKVYTVMLCTYTGIKKDIDDAFAFIGKNRDGPYLEKVLDKLGKMGKGEPKYLELKKQLEDSFCCPTAEQGKGK